MSCIQSPEKLEQMHTLLPSFCPVIGSRCGGIPDYTCYGFSVLIGLANSSVTLQTFQASDGQVSKLQD